MMILHDVTIAWRWWQIEQLTSGNISVPLNSNTVSDLEPYLLGDSLIHLRRADVWAASCCKAIRIEPFV